jgi:hypothetical protein
MFDRIVQLLILGVALATLILAMPNYTPPANMQDPVPMYVGRG